MVFTGTPTLGTPAHVATVRLTLRPPDKDIWIDSATQCTARHARADACAVAQHQRRSLLGRAPSLQTHDRTRWLRPAPASKDDDGVVPPAVPARLLLGEFEDAAGRPCLMLVNKDLTCSF